MSIAALVSVLKAWISILSQENTTCNKLVRSEESWMCLQLLMRYVALENCSAWALPGMWIQSGSIDAFLESHQTRHEMPYSATWGDYTSMPGHGKGRSIHRSKTCGRAFWSVSTQWCLFSTGQSIWERVETPSSSTHGLSKDELSRVDPARLSQTAFYSRSVMEISGNQWFSHGALFHACNRLVLVLAQIMFLRNMKNSSLKLQYCWLRQCGHRTSLTLSHICQTSHFPIGVPARERL